MFPASHEAGLPPIRICSVNAADPGDLGVLDRAEAELEDAERALQRLDEGTYSTCEACGRAIGEDLLARLPMTRRCAHHAPSPRRAIQPGPESLAWLCLFAQARECAGTSEVGIDGDSVGKVLDAAVGRFGPRLGAVIAYSAIWLTVSPQPASCLSATTTRWRCCRRFRAIRGNAAVASVGRTSAEERRDPRPTAVLSLSWSPQDPVDLGDLVEQLLAHGGVGRLLGLAGGLGRRPEQVVELGVLRQMLGLEVVRPKDPEVVLDEVGALLFDQDGPGLEGVVGRGVELLHGRLHRLGFDPRLGGVVHATRQVAMRVNGHRAAQSVEQGEQREVRCMPAPWLVIGD